MSEQQNDIGLKAPQQRQRAVIIVLTKASIEYVGFVDMDNLASFSTKNENELRLTKTRRVITSRGLSTEGSVMSVVSFDSVTIVDPSNDNLTFKRDDIFKALAAPESFQQQYEAIVSSIPIATPAQVSAIARA